MSRLDSEIQDAQSNITSVIDYLKSLDEEGETDTSDEVYQLEQAHDLLDSIENDGDEMEREIKDAEEQIGSVEIEDALNTIESLESNLDELKRDLGSW